MGGQGPGQSPHRVPVGKAGQGRQAGQHWPFEEPSGSPACWLPRVFRTDDRGLVWGI